MTKTSKALVRYNPQPNYTGLVLLGLAVLVIYLLLKNRGQAATSTYTNIEKIELQDIDPVLLMPRTIIVHRDYKVR